MENFTRRFIVAVFILIFFFSILCIRIWYLQILKGDEFEEFSRNNRIRNIRVAPPRGRILDREGRGIVVNRSSFDLYAVPSEIENKEAFISFLSELLAIDNEELDNRIYGSPDNRKFNQVLIARDITRDQLAIFESRRDLFPWAFVDVSTVREYPYKSLGANFLGYLGKTTKSDLLKYEDLTGFDLIGKSGLEKTYQQYLHGDPGYIQKVTDAFGREIKSNVYSSDINTIESIPGDDLILTVDLDLQKDVEDMLSEYTGAVVAMNVQTGEILAMASSPSFDPSVFVKGVDAKHWNELTSNTEYPLLNRVTRGLYPPGSVYKIVTASAALQEKAIDQNTKVFCPGHYQLGRKTFRCWKSGGHGWVNVFKAIVESCDVFFYDVSLKVGIDKIYKYSRQLGYGDYTGIDIDEKQGISPSSAWKKRSFNLPWYKGDTVNVSIGQGYMSVTPLQVAVMTAAVANGGYKVTPHFIKEIISNSGEKLYSHKNERTKVQLDERVISLIGGAMTSVVNADNGTARRARLPEILVAGKTGTAQVVALDLHKAGGSKYDHHAWFTSFAPADKPEIAVTVLVEHGGRGGAVASPVARRVMESYFGVVTEQNRTQSVALQQQADNTPEPETALESELQNEHHDNKSNKPRVPFTPNSQ